MSLLTLARRPVAFLFAVSIGLCTTFSAVQAFNPQPDPPGKELQSQVLPGQDVMFKEVDPAPATGINDVVLPGTGGGEVFAFEGYKPGDEVSAFEGYKLGSELFAFEGYKPGKGGGTANLVGAGFGGGAGIHIDKMTKPQPTPPCDPLIPTVNLSSLGMPIGNLLPNLPTTPTPQTRTAVVPIQPINGLQNVRIVPAVQMGRAGL